MAVGKRWQLAIGGSYRCGSWGEVADTDVAFGDRWIRRPIVYTSGFWKDTSKSVLSVKKKGCADVSSLKGKIGSP